MTQKHPFFSDKKVLVTGATGLLGTNMVRKLHQIGATVRAVTHVKSPQEKIAQVEYVQADLTSREECSRVVAGMDYVIHCAAQSFGAKIMREDPKCLVTPNVIMNANLLDASAEEGITQFLFFSSNTVYPVLERPVREDEATGTFFELYEGVATVKYFTEKLCEFYSKKYAMQCVVIRPANFYGPFDKFGEGGHVIPALIERALHKEDPYVVWGTGENKKDFLYVEDVVEGALHAFVNGITPVNLGSGTGVTIKEIVSKILDITKYSGQIEYDSTKPDAIKYRVLDTTKLKFIPKTSLHEGLKKTIEWHEQKLTTKHQ